MVASITRLRRPFLGEIFADEPDRIADGIELDELAEGRRALQPLRNLTIAKEHDVSVQPAAGLERGHVVGPHTMLDLQPGSPLLDVRDGASRRALVCVQAPETLPRPTMQFDEPHRIIQPVQLCSGHAMGRHRAC